MKIDEACINHNVTRMLKDVIDTPWEYSEDDAGMDHIRLVTLGYVKGILDFAETLKEVLKT